MTAAPQTDTLTILVHASKTLEDAKTAYVAAKTAYKKAAANHATSALSTALGVVPK